MGRTVVFHNADDALAPEDPNGDAETDCKVTHMFEEKLGNPLVFYLAQCKLEPLPPGRTHEFSVTYKVNWMVHNETASVHVVGKHDPSPDTSARRINFERLSGFSSSRVLKLGTNYTLEGSKTSNNPALK